MIPCYIIQGLFDCINYTDIPRNVPTSLNNTVITLYSNSENYPECAIIGTNTIVLHNKYVFLSPFIDGAESIIIPVSEQVDTPFKTHLYTSFDKTHIYKSLVIRAQKNSLRIKIIISLEGLLTDLGSKTGRALCPVYVGQEKLDLICNVWL